MSRLGMYSSVLDSKRHTGTHAMLLVIMGPSRWIDRCSKPALTGPFTAFGYQVYTYRDSIELQKSYWNLRSQDIWHGSRPKHLYAPAHSVI